MDNLILSEKYGILQIASCKDCGKHKIVNATTTEFDDTISLSGIVDQHNIEVFPFCSDILIYYLEKNHFLIEKGGIYYHYKFNLQNNPILKNSFEHYKKVNEHHFLLTKNERKSIYNLEREATPFYTTLGEFAYSEEYGKEVANFFDRVTTNKGKIIEFVGKIDMNNNFINIYDQTNDTFLPIRTSLEYIEYCNQLQKETKNKMLLAIQKIYTRYKTDNN